MPTKEEKIAKINKFHAIQFSGKDEFKTNDLTEAKYLSIKKYKELRPKIPPKLRINADLQRLGGLRAHETRLHGEKGAPKKCIRISYWKSTRN